MTKKIKRILEEYKITQTALAHAYGCDPGPMSQFLNGVRPIPDMSRMIAALSKCLPDGYSVTMTHEIHAKGGEVSDNIFYVGINEPWPDDEE